MNVILGTRDIIYYPIFPTEVTPKKKDGRTYGIVVEITRDVLGTVPLVTVRSPMQVNVIVILYYDTLNSSNIIAFMCY